MDSPAFYLQWGFVLISLPNLLLLAAMIVLFVLALVVPFPGAEENEKEARRAR